MASSELLLLEMLCARFAPLAVPTLCDVLAAVFWPDFLFNFEPDGVGMGRDSWFSISLSDRVRWIEGDDDAEVTPGVPCPEWVAPNALSAEVRKMEGVVIVPPGHISASFDAPELLGTPYTP